VGQRAISVPLEAVNGGQTRSLTDNLLRRSARVTSLSRQIPKLTLRVRFSSPDPVENDEASGLISNVVASTELVIVGPACPLRARFAQR